MTLQEFFSASPEAAVAFSGGVDSAVLLWAAAAYGKRARAYCVRSPFQPAFELRDARRLAEAVGAPLTFLPVDTLSVPDIAANRPDRCYHCKRAIFSAIRQAAEADGLPLLLDGTNASDDPADRPGMRALAELGVRSPLRECGLTKADVRRLAREAGLDVWDKPAYACLATRVPAGTPITQADLDRVEAGEAALAALGFSDFRLRLYHGGARLQLPAKQLTLALERREAILTALEPYFSDILLDLRARASQEGTT